MVNYNEGKIYKIENMNGDKCYIGSTTKKYLSQRMQFHRSDYNKWLKGNKGKCMVYEIFDEFGIDNCRIVLLEACPCDSKDALIAREVNYMKSIPCVNKRTEVKKSPEERRLYQRKWEKEKRDKDKAKRETEKEEAKSNYKRSNFTD